MIGYGTSGTSHDFFVFNAAGSVWNGSAFVTWADGDYQDYRVAATETGTSGRFTASDVSGAYYYDMRERAATLALSYVAWNSEAVSLKQIAAKTDVIGTFNATVPVRSVGSTIQLYVGELHEVEITTSSDLSANTMTVEFDDVRGTSVATIADGSLTKTTTTLAFNATAAITTAARTLSYAVRDTTTKEVYLYGKCVVDNQPLA